MAVLKTRAAEWASAYLTLPGEEECGDRHFVVDVPDGMLVAVVDGVGHGAEAAHAAEVAIRTVEQFAKEPIEYVVQRCDEALRDTRGVAMSLASFTPSDRTMNWLGVGNVAGRVQRRSVTHQFPHESLLLRPGVVGSRPARVQASAVRIGRGDLVIFATDGIDPEFTDSVDIDKHAESIAETILATHAKTTDDALVFAIRFLS